MLQPQRFAHEVDPGPVQIQARNVAFETADKPMSWIPGHPVASHVVNLLNILLPAGERWFIETFNEALPLIKDPKLADDVRGFIGQEAMHAEAHDTVMNDYLVNSGGVIQVADERHGFSFERARARAATIASASSGLSVALPSCSTVIRCTPGSIPVNRRAPLTLSAASSRLS